MPALESKNKKGCLIFFYQRFIPLGSFAARCLGRMLSRPWLIAHQKNSNKNVEEEEPEKEKDEEEEERSSGSE